MFFSAATGGFYDVAIHGDGIPADAVEITDEDYAALMAAQPAGKRIAADAEGRPIAVSPTIEQLKSSKNAAINSGRLAANLSSFEHAGKQIACDALSRSDLDGVANHIALFGSFPPEFPGAWKAMDNTFLPMASVDDFKAMYQSMTAAGAANFNHAQDLKQQLAAATTAEDIDAVPAW